MHQRNLQYVKTQLVEMMFFIWYNLGISCVNLVFVVSFPLTMLRDGYIERNATCWAQIYVTICVQPVLSPQFFNPQYLKKSHEVTETYAHLRLILFYLCYRAYNRMIAD